MSALLFLPCVSATAKDRTPLVAIVLYEGNSGAAYVELYDFGVNGKREVYVCKGSAITGGEYKHLERTILEPGMVLERTQNSGLTLSANSGSRCVVPANLKLDKSRSYSIVELADMAAMTGTVAGRSSNAGDTSPTNILSQMQLHLVSEADTELAEFRRAERANAIALWSIFLRQFPTSSHLAEGRKALARLIVEDGDRHFAAYHKTQDSEKPDLDELKKARVAAQEALEVVKGFVPADKLRLDTDSELYKIVGLVRSELTRISGQFPSTRPATLISARPNLTCVN